MGKRKITMKNSTIISTGNKTKKKPNTSQIWHALASDLKGNGTVFKKHSHNDASGAVLCSPDSHEEVKFLTHRQG